MLLAKRIKELRLEKNLTQEELGKLVGDSIRTVINYEKGSCYPKSHEI